MILISFKFDHQVPSGGHPIMFLHGVPAQEMQIMLDFMYTGQAHLPRSHVKPLLKTAEALKIKGLGVSHDDATPIDIPLDKNPIPTNKFSPVSTKDDQLGDNVKQTEIKLALFSKTSIENLSDTDGNYSANMRKRNAMDSHLVEENHFKRIKFDVKNDPSSTVREETHSARQSHFLVNAVQESEDSSFSKKPTNVKKTVSVKLEPDSIFCNVPSSQEKSPRIRNQNFKTVQETSSDRTMESLAAIFQLEEQVGFH